MVGLMLIFVGFYAFLAGCVIFLPGATLETHAFTEPGKTPMSDDDVKPFAALKALRDGQSDPDSNDS